MVISKCFIWVGNIKFSRIGTPKGERLRPLFHQYLFGARKIYKRSPGRHIDVGSSVGGFVSHVASFHEREVMDVRTIIASVPGIEFIRQDVMDLDPSYYSVADSVSCLHALEHFGLGRYGDPVEYDGWEKGLQG